jgi:hypothetical protein
MIDSGFKKVGQNRKKFNEKFIPFLTETFELQSSFRQQNDVKSGIDIKYFCYGEK